MTLYVLNTTVIPSGTDGIWETSIISVEAARYNIKSFSFVSAVGHESTAEIMTELLGVEIPVNRIAVKPLPGDRLLCFKLKGRAPEGVILNQNQIEDLGYEWVIMTYHGTIGAALDSTFKGLNNYICNYSNLWLLLKATSSPL